MMMKFLKKSNCPRTRDRKATERALLLAAAKLFALKGYEATRTLEIAKEAGANEALILRYFGGKEGLLISLMKDEEALQIVVQAQGDAICTDLEAMPIEVGKGGLKAALLQYFKNSQDIIRAKSPFMKIASSRALVDSEMAGIVRERLMERQMQILQKRLKLLIENSGGKVKPSDLDRVTMLIASGTYMLNFMMRQVYGIEGERLDASLEMLSEMIADRFS
jgi:AcrR family transcriptional regulator